MDVIFTYSPSLYVFESNCVWHSRSVRGKEDLVHLCFINTTIPYLIGLCKKKTHAVLKRHG